MQFRWGTRKNKAVDLTPKSRGKGFSLGRIMKLGGSTLTLPLFLLALMLAYHYYRENTQLRSSFTAGTMTHAQEADIIAQLSEIMVLPKGEAPLIATISNVALLQGQPFYVNAQRGDKVFVYCAARKTILYDPLAKKIIEFASDVPPQTCPTP